LRSARFPKWSPDDRKKIEIIYSLIFKISKSELMDDLKNIVIQNLEQEGTLGSLRAQLRA